MGKIALKSPFFYSISISTLRISYWMNALFGGSQLFSPGR